MLFASSAVTAFVSVGLTLARVAVLTMLRDLVAVVNVGNGCRETAPDVCKDVMTEPLGTSDRVSVAVCTAEVESVVSEASGTLTDAVRNPWRV